MPLVDYISVRGFRSISVIERLQMRPLNVLIGANGSGKSNFVELFSFLRSVRLGKLQSYVIEHGGAERILHFGSKVTSRIYVDISFKDESNGYELVLAPTEEDSLYPYQEEVRFWDKLQYPKPYTTGLFRQARGLEAGISAGGQRGVADWVQIRLGSWRLYHFHDTSSLSPMRKVARVEDNSYLREDGANLAPFLFFLRQKHFAAYSLIERTVQRVAPFFESFLLSPSRLNEDVMRLEWRHKGSEEYFDATSLSDGTLRFIALTTLMLQPKELLPSLILLDEPELGLHPYAIELLGSLLRQVSKHSQVIAASQSALLLDILEPEDILVANRVDGGTEVTRLDAGRLKKWLDDYSLGELWEKNEFAGRPKSE